MTHSESGRLSTEYNASARLAEFRNLCAQGALTVAVSDRLATEAADTIIARFNAGGEYLLDAVTLLGEISTLNDASHSFPGTRAIFTQLIERLSDSFNPLHCRLYDRVMAQIITIARVLPRGAAVDAALRKFGLNSEADLLARKRRVSAKRPVGNDSPRDLVRKVLVLSRVTLGADVAVTSIVLQKSRKIFRNAERIIVGSPKLQQLFGGDATLRFLDIEYHRGDLLDRLMSWLPVLNAVAYETRDLGPGEFIVIDPDSRFLQLGLLPVTADESQYIFLESRRFGNLGDGSISRIALDWLNRLFGCYDGSDPILPEINLRREVREFAQSAVCSVKQREARLVVAMSFGAGGNEQKRLPDATEQELLLQILRDDCTVVLDKGAGNEELDRANSLVAAAKADGWNVVELDEADAANPAKWVRQAPADLLTWQGDIGHFAALVGESAEYIGYDSAGQHIAAALGIPTVDIFIAGVAPVFQERWTPSGRAAVRAIRTGADSAAVLREILACHARIKASGRG